MTVSEDSLEPELASVEDAEPELSVEEEEPELSDVEPELSVEELPLEPSELVLPSLALDPLEDSWPEVVVALVSPVELDVDEGAFDGAFKPLVPSALAEARESFAFELLAFGSLAFAVELFSVRP